MGEALEVVIFCEDTVHESFLRALLQRLSREEKRPLRLRTVSGRGGHGKAISEFKAFQRLKQADLLVVAIDANCKPWNDVRKEVEGVVDHSRFASVVIACPEPHIERWFLADPDGLRQACGTEAVQYALSGAKCKRDFYKELLRKVLREAGQEVTLGGAEFAFEIVENMDFYRASKNEPSLKYAIEAIRNALRR